MFLIGDLHMHSNCSDGSLDVEELVFIAAKKGLSCLSVTDHNFLHSRDEWLNLGRKYSIKILNGVELSCFDYTRNRKVHILCYCFENYGVLEPVCEQATKIRVEVGKQKAEFVCKNFVVSQNLINKYRSKSGCIYQQNMVHALLECGYCDSIYGDLYDSLSSKNLNISVPNDLDVRRVLELVHKAGGKAVMAHPFVYDSFELLNELVVEKLIDGVEVWHPKNSKPNSELLLKLVEKNNLIATGGTDFHGLYSSCYLSQIGNFTTPEVYLKRLID